MLGLISRRTRHTSRISIDWSSIVHRFPLAKAPESTRRDDLYSKYENYTGKDIDFVMENLCLGIVETLKRLVEYILTEK